MSEPRNQKFELPVFALSLALLWSCGCGRLHSPQKTFDHAQLMLAHGELDSARREATVGCQSLASRNQEWAWKFCLLEAEILLAQGLSKDVPPLVAPPLPPGLARSDLAIKQKMLQAGAYVLVGRLQDASDSLQNAQDLCESLRSPLAGEVARSRGVLELRKNDLEGADHWFRKSLQIAEQQQDSYLETTDLLDLGQEAIEKEHYDESIDWLNAARRKAEFLEYRQLAEAALGNLAWAYYKMGDFDRALAMYQEAEKTATSLGTVYYRIAWLNNIGLVYYQMDQPSTAEHYYRKTLVLAQDNQTPAPIMDALTELAFVSVKTGKLTEAQQYSEQSFQLAHTRNDRSSELSAILVEGEIAARQGKPEEAEEKFHQVVNDQKSDLSLRWQAQNDLANLYEQDHRLPEADKQYQQALATIERSRAALQHEEFKLPFLANAAHLYDDYIRFLVEQGKDRRALQEADYSRARTLSEGLGVLPKKSRTDAPAVDPQRIARQAHATILFYWLGRKQSYLWAIDGSHTERFPLPPAAEIDAAVERYRRALVEGWQDVLQTANADGTHLYDILVAPARKLIAPNSRVILITDGSLDGLNFETLLVPGSPESSAPLHYWIADATVLSASSLHVLAASQTRRERGTGKLLLIGDASPASHEYAALPNAAQEIQNVQNHFVANVTTYTHDLATPSAYLASDPGQFSYIHFVAHATASKLSPLDSAIVLSRSSTEQDSFKLYARDITQHPLHADLVTISSCEGAGTEAYSGEGLIGLSWAFVRAGAHNVIGALWDVNDASTATLMDHLYDGLKRGQSPDAALRSAKLSLLHSDALVRKPFYWAPFQLYIGR
jgi:CHAT domain-containing protein